MLLGACPRVKERRCSCLRSLRNDSVREVRRQQPGDQQVLPVLWCSPASRGAAWLQSQPESPASTCCSRSSAPPPWRASGPSPGASGLGSRELRATRRPRGARTGAGAWADASDGGAISDWFTGRPESLRCNHDARPAQSWIWTAPSRTSSRLPVTRSIAWSRAPGLRSATGCTAAAEPWLGSTAECRSTRTTRPPFTGRLRADSPTADPGGIRRIASTGAARDAAPSVQSAEPGAPATHGRSARPLTPSSRWTRSGACGALRDALARGFLGEL